MGQKLVERWKWWCLKCDKKGENYVSGDQSFLDAHAHAMNSGHATTGTTCQVLIDEPEPTPVQAPSSKSKKKKRR